MTKATALNINFNTGRGIFPSSKAENLCDILRSSRLDPLRNYTQNKPIQFMGDVKAPALSQAVEGGINIINPNIHEVRQIPLVSDRRRTPVKTENRRKDKEANIALWDIRNNTSLNNSTKVMPNYYRDKLSENAKGKVRMTNTAEAMRVQYPNERQDFYITGHQSIDSYIPTLKYSMEAFNTGSKDTNTLNYFEDLSQPGKSSSFGTGSRARVEETSYNPFLPQSQGNLSEPTDSKISYPDERMTRYSGERKYMTKGDKIMMAADLAKSENLKQRRQLQAQAHDALMGIARAPRMLGADISKGINTTNTYNAIGIKQQLRQEQGYGQESKERGLKYAGIKDTGVISQKFVDEFDFNEKDVGKTVSDVDIRRTGEHYVPRTSDINRQATIKQNMDVYYTPGIEKITSKLTDEDIVRKLYAEQFGNNPHNQKSTDNKGMFYKFVETFKGWLGSKSDDDDFNRLKTNEDDLRKKYGNIDAKTFKDTVERMEIILKDDSLSLQQRQAFNKDLREQIKEYLEDYNDNIKQDLAIHDILNNIAERCVINDNGVRKLDEDKFIEEVLNSGELLERMDELKVRTARNIMTEDKYMYLRNVCEDYDANIISNWIENLQNEFDEMRGIEKFGDRRYKNDLGFDKIKIYYTEKGVKEEYDDYLRSRGINEVEKPVSILTNNGEEVIRNVLIKDNDKFMLLQRKENIEKPDEYLLLKIEPEDLMDALGLSKDRLDMKEDKRRAGTDGSIYNLTFEEHLKLIKFVDNVKNKDFILVSKNPIHPYQRDLLNNDEVASDIGIISNVELGIENTFDKNVRKSEHIIEHSKNIATFKGNDEDINIRNIRMMSDGDKDERIYTSGKVQTQMKPQEMYKKFGELL